MQALVGILVLVLAPAEVDKTRELLLGRWEADGDKAPTVEFTPAGVAHFATHVGDTVLNVEATYEVVEPTALQIEVRLGDLGWKARYKLAITPDALTLTDDKGKETRFKRARVTASILGKWECTEGDAKGTVLEFNKNGKFRASAQGVTVDGKYKLDEEGRLETDVQGSTSKGKVKIVGDSLVYVDDKGVEYPYKRVK